MRRVLVTLALLAFGCSDDTGVEGGIYTPDSNSRNIGEDTGGIADSGSADAGGGADVGVDTVDDMRGSVDLGAVDDAGAVEDMGAADMGTPSEDMGTMTDMGEPPVGMICPYPEPGEYTGECDVVNNQGCTSDEQTCIVIVVLDGNDEYVSGGCTITDRHTLGEGEPCLDTEQRCAPGLMCISFEGTCQRLCYLDDAVGCQPDEYCRRPSFEWPSFGYCDDLCRL